MEFRRRLKLTIAIAALVVAAIPVTFAFAAQDGTASGPTASASVVKVETKKAAKKKVVHRKFRLWAHPTPGQVRTIIAAEARRWKISAASLSRRVACESRYRWYASNGQYQGVLQFGANAFYRGLSTIKSRTVTIRRTKTRKVHDRRVTLYSDGRVSSRRTTPRRQRIVVVYHGRIPRRPSIGNAFAQLRIGAQAIRGISAVRSAEWSCSA